MSIDVNYESHVNETDAVIRDRTIPADGVKPLEYSDILKFSNCHNITVTNCTISGGKEDCIDAVRGNQYDINNTTLSPVYNGITLKGSIDTIEIDNVGFTKHGTDCDIEFGQFDNYWYIGRKPTRNITIKDTNAYDGKSLKVKLWDAEEPVVFNSNVKVIKIPKIIWFPYFVFRAIQVRGITNIFKPVKDDTFITST